MRKIEQPEYASSKIKSRRFLEEKLGITEYALYEIDDLLNLNVPYFYHRPGSCDFFDGNNTCYKSVFPECAIKKIKEQLLNRDEKQKEFNIAIIRKHLQPFEVEPLTGKFLSRV